MGTLGERRAAILRAVVSGYIRTGDPIGSASLASRYRLGVSAATIRNDMAALEKLGFLRQPHTSSGRVPTDRGYRFYVDAIPSTQAPPSQWRRSIARYFGEPPRDPNEVIRGAALLLSRITRYGAVAQPPPSAPAIGRWVRSPSWDPRGCTTANRSRRCVRWPSTSGRRSSDWPGNTGTDGGAGPLRRPGGVAGRDAGRHPQGVPASGPGAPPRREPGPGGRPPVQGDQPGLPDAVRSGPAPPVRPVRG